MGYAVGDKLGFSVLGLSKVAGQRGWASCRPTVSRPGREVGLWVLLDLTQQTEQMKRIKRFKIKIEIRKWESNIKLKLKIQGLKLELQIQSF